MLSYDGNEGFEDFEDFQYKFLRMPGHSMTALRSKIVGKDVVYLMVESY